MAGCRLHPDISIAHTARRLFHSLVIQTSFLGDVVLTTPLLDVLATRGTVDVVTTPGAAPLLANHPAIRRVVAWDKRGRERGLVGLWRLARTVRAPDADAVAYCVQGSWRTAALAVAAGYRVRVGFDTSDGRLLYTRRVPYRAGAHHAARLHDLAGSATGAETRVRPRVFPGEAERAAVDALLGDWRGADDLVALAPGSIWGTKRWPHFPALAALLAAQHRLVIVGSRDDQPLAAAIETAAPGRTRDATGRLSLLASAELLRRCVLLVSNDSAPQHLASAVGTPTVTIFGPTIPGFGFGPLAPRSAVAEHPALPCRPCHRHGPPVCPLGHWRCMRDLDPAAIMAQVQPILHASSRLS